MRMFYRLQPILLCVTAAPLLAQQSPRPAPARPANGAAAVTAQNPGFRTVYQLCQRREAELAAQNNMLLERTQIINAEQDGEKKKALAEQMNALFQILSMTEASWNRLSCAAILYPARPAVQR